jgi:hypothetical protein
VSGRLFVAQVSQECRLHHLVCFPHVTEMSKKVRNRITVKGKKEVFQHYPFLLGCLDGIICNDHVVSFVYLILRMKLLRRTVDIKI